MKDYWVKHRSKGQWNWNLSRLQITWDWQYGFMMRKGHGLAVYN